MSTPTVRAAVVSGADAASVGAALQGIAQTVTAIQTVAELVETVQDMPPGSVDLYVQLPVLVPRQGDNAVEVVRHFLAEGLIRRFDAVSAMLPVLAPKAKVALVSGNHPDASNAPDNPQARVALMQVLAHTLILERGEAAPGGADAGIEAKIVSGVPDPARLIELIMEPQEKPVRVISELVEAEPWLDYSGWRDAIMALEETHA